MACMDSGLIRESNQTWLTSVRDSLINSVVSQNASDHYTADPAAAADGLKAYDWTNDNFIRVTFNHIPNIANSNKFNSFAFLEELLMG